MNTPTNNPTNRSNHRGVPRTKIERTISLRLIHTYSVDDPAGLRRPELRATGVERREEQPFGVYETGSNEREREGAALRERTTSIVCSRGAPPPLFIGGGGLDPPWRRGQP